MKKLFTSLALISLLQPALFAQISITSAIGYVPGDAFSVQLCNTTSDMPSAASSTAAVNVDYSGVTLSGSPVPQNYVAPSSTPYSSSFPTATVSLAVTSSGGNAGYTYLTNNGTRLEMVGIATSAYTMTYSNPQLAISFPTALNDHYTDAFAASYTVNGVTVKRSGNMDITADAWGNIKTPSGTFPYLRLKIIQDITDSMFMAGSLVGMSIQSTTTYNYMHSTIKSPIFSYSEVLTGSGEQKSAYYYIGLPTAVNENVSLDINEKLFPNPAQGQLNVSFDLKSAEKISWKISDVTGKVKSGPFAVEAAAGHHEIPADITSLQAGLYFLTMESADGRNKTMKFTVK